MRPVRPWSRATAPSSARLAGGEPSYPTTMCRNAAGDAAVVTVFSLALGHPAQRSRSGDLHWRKLPTWKRRIVRCCGRATTCPVGTVRTRAYDVNVPFMQLERHGWDIHAV